VTTGYVKDNVESADVEVEMSKTNGDPTTDEGVRKMREAVRDVPDPDRRPVTSKDVKRLRKAGLDDLAEIAESYVVPARRVS